MSKVSNISNRLPKSNGNDDNGNNDSNNGNGGDQQQSEQPQQPKQPETINLSEIIGTFPLQILGATYENDGKVGNVGKVLLHLGLVSEGRNVRIDLVIAQLKFQSQGGVNDGTDTARSHCR